MRLACQYLAHVICSCIRRTCSVAPFPRPQRRERLLASHNLGRGAGRRRLIACGCCVGEALWTAPHRPLLASSDACRLLIEWSIVSSDPLILQFSWSAGSLDVYVLKLNFQPYLLQVQVLFSFIHLMDDENFSRVHQLIWASIVSRSRSYLLQSV